MKHIQLRLDSVLLLVILGVSEKVSLLVPASASLLCNKGHGMCYPVCEMVHIKEPLLLIGKSSLCGGIGFPFSL